ncbi:hypothetical protein [Haloplanus sp. C73]|uniref:hypothetical protein n=1 Tax=Haloplanus sp. C73 TaxID=3421641 RepID=UPI003EBD5E14
MHRRTLLRTTPLLLLGGCAGGGGGDGDDPRVTDRDLTDTGECSEGDSETATVDASTTTVRISGCITGPNGCSVASLDSATVEGDELVAVVTTERDAPPDTSCTQALVYRSYAATIALDHRVTSVRVVHDTPSGRVTVTDITGGGDHGSEDTAHELDA